MMNQQQRPPTNQQQRTKIRCQHCNKEFVNIRAHKCKVLLQKQQVAARAEHQRRQHQRRHRHLGL